MERKGKGKEERENDGDHSNLLNLHYRTEGQDDRRGFVIVND